MSRVVTIPNFEDKSVMTLTRTPAGAAAGGGGGGLLPYMSYMGMCRCEGFGFQAVYCGIEFINQRVYV